MRVPRYGTIATAVNDFGDDVVESDERGSWPTVVVLSAMAVLAVSLASRFHESEPTAVALRASLLSKSHLVSDENKPRFYHHQLINHFTDEEPEHWSNRYYQSTKHFGGPGHPIFLVVGGEGAMDDGMFYPFVTDILAKRFKAAVIQVEHRFYGPYTPVENATVTELLELLTPHQAMSDMVRLVGHVRDSEFGCYGKRNSKDYCPVISVGGSYPGFLSAMFRIVYPDFVDISYAASAPLLMYAQAVDQDVYYDIVTASAERSSPGCAAAVRTTLHDTIQTVQQAGNLEDATNAVGVCPGTVPAYISDQTMFKDALVQMASYKFADANMGNYPPGPNTGMYKTCQIFQQVGKSSLDKMRNFLLTLDATSDDATTCLDMMTQLPKGGMTLEDTDGEYNDGIYWDFQTCTNVIFRCGWSASSMFPPEEVTYKSMTDRCRERFGVTPRPWELTEKWGFDDLSEASNIIFTNGLQDMWSGGSYLSNVSDTVLAINFENGAHHSDLFHRAPSEEEDTDDLRRGFVKIQDTIEAWLHELKHEK